MRKFFKNLISSITALSLCAAMISITPVSADDSAFGGGTGTSSDPYIISTADHLTQLSADVDAGNSYADKYFKMTNDITLSGTWTSIGAYRSDYSSLYPFSGIFDGGGHKIRGLSQNGDNIDYRGLFAANKGTIKNLTVNGDIRLSLTDVNFQSEVYVGGIVSFNEGSIVNCAYEGNVIATRTGEYVARLSTAGVAGYNNDGGTVENCHNSAAINAADHICYVGGIIGWNCGTIRTCYNTGTLTVPSEGFDTSLGGIVGLHDPESAVKDCYNTGNISSDCENAHVGGIIGSTNAFYSCKAEYCFNTGLISSTGASSMTGQIIGDDGRGGNGIPPYNCYYLDPTTTSSVGYIELFSNDVTLMSDSSAVAKTEAEFASGEVAYLLNGESSQGDLAWYQTLGSDGLPGLDSSHGIVYYSASSGYSNTAPVLSLDRKLYVDFMGRGSTPATESPGKAKLTSEDVGNEFWVGVAVDKVDDLALFTDGVYSLELAFEYDPNYLEPYHQSQTTDAEADWASELQNGNLSTLNDDLWWNSSQYEIVSVRSTDIDVDSDREDKTLAQTRDSDRWKMCTVCVRFKSTETFSNTRFEGLTDTSKQYLLKLPFLLKSVPAETAVDQNPVVLSLVRGPETFDIGSGATGVNPYASWEATVDDPLDETNLKNLFTYNGDILLFDSGSSVENIVAVKPTPTVDPSATPDPQATTDPSATPVPDTIYTLSTSKQLQEDGFKPETDTYYLSVSNDVSPIKLQITTAEQPTVKVNGTSVTSTLKSTKLYETDLFALDELNKDVANGGEVDGFNNTVEVTVGSSTYTIYIRRLLKPKIELNYGNSPYGEIMRADNIPDSDKQAAKDAFDVNNMYDVDYLPTGCSGSIIYQPLAWNEDETSSVKPTDSKVNLDRDDYALFVYQGEEFIDPGFVAYDSMGEAVPESTMEKTMDIKKMMSNDVQYMADSSVSLQTISNVTSSANTFDNIKTMYIRPDIYDLNYSFTDSITGEVVTNTRKVVMLWTVGDANMSAVFNPSDASYMTQIIKRIATPLNDVTGITRCLYYYRILDINYSGVFNPTDTSYATQTIKRIATQYKFYREINTGS